MAMRRVRCGSSVYVQKKSAWSWAACACCCSAVTVKLLRLAGLRGGTVAVVVEARIVRGTELQYQLAAIGAEAEAEADADADAVATGRVRGLTAVRGLTSVRERPHVKISVNPALSPGSARGSWALWRTGGVWAHRRAMVGQTQRHPPRPIRGTRGQTISRTVYRVFMRLLACWCWACSAAL